MKQIRVRSAAYAGPRFRRLTPFQAQVHVFCARNRLPAPAPNAARTGASAGTSASGETRTRTGDTTIFSRVLYQLSYLAVRA